MTKIKYDVTDVEGGGDFKLPPIGLYKCKIHQCLDAKPEGKDRRLELIYEIIGTDTKYMRIYDYCNLESEASAFRLRQLVDAVGLKAKGTLDTEKIEGEIILVRVKHESYQGEMKPKAGSLLPAQDEDDEDEDDEDLDEDESGDEDEDEDEDAYDEMPNPALKEELKTRGLPVGGKRQDLLDRLRENDAEDDSEDDEADDDDTYDSWSPEELKEELKTRGLKTAGKKSVLVARLEKDDESDDDPF